MRREGKKKAAVKGKGVGGGAGRSGLECEMKGKILFGGRGEEEQ